MGKHYRKDLIFEFDIKFIELAKKHIDEGWSFNCFSGRHNIPNDLWIKWSREIPELDKIRKEYNLKTRHTRRHYAV